MADLALFYPGLALALVSGAVAGWLWARVGKVPLLLGLATATNFTAILALTLSPVGPPEAGALIGVCDLRQLGPGSMKELLTLGEPSLNVLLFVPLGLCIALHRRAAARRVVLACAVALPFVIELVQLEVTQLGRFCDSMDVADNEVGLVLGFTAGVGWLGLRAILGGARGMNDAPVE